MRDETHAAALIFGRLLAEDVEPLRPRVRRGACTSDDQHLVAVADAMLRQLERLDVGESEVADRDRELLQRGAGEVWLRIAESGRMGKDYLNHVLAHLATLGVKGAAGEEGPSFVRPLLRALSAMDTATLDTAALAFPEYVGLIRAFRDVPNAVARMRAALAS